MKKTMTYMRPVILLSVGMVAMIGIFCEPAEESATWLADLLVSKLIGFAAMGALVLMTRRRRGSLFQRAYR